MTVSGTGDAGDTISVVASDGTQSTDAFTTTVGQNGTWSIAGINVSQLTDGTITFTATASNGSGDTGEATATATLDTTAPGLDFSSVTDPINLGLAASTSASGTGEVGANISLVVTDGTHTTTTYTTTVGAAGTWSIEGIDVSGLADGTITYTVTATDAAGNTAEGTLTAEKDTIAPEVELTSVTDPITLANVTSTSASGTGEVGATISLVVTDGTHTTSTYTTTVGEDGTWTIEDIDVSELADGTITFTATASDAAGNTAESTLTASKTAIAISLVTDPINAANANNTSASGTGQVGATVTLVVSDGTNTTIEYTTVIGQDGTWLIEGIDVSGLADGNITYTATATDESENTASNSKVVVKDTTPPQATILSVTDPINLSNVTATFANGSGEVGATISVVASDGTNTTSALSTTVGSTGTWAITAIDMSGLADGTITYTITATDAAGNTTIVTQTALKDTVAPEVNIDSVTDPITIASSANVTASGTGEVGASISLVVSDGTNSTTAYTTTVAADGTWVVEGIDVSALADGAVTYTVTSTDAAFNTAEATMTATKSTVHVTVVTDPINSSNASNTSASGTGEVGATISVVASDGTNTTATYTTTVASDGTWSITGIDVSGLADGEITFTATATDSNENAAHSSLTSTKDTVAPSVAITAVTDPINSSNASAVSASGTGDVGSLVVLTATDGTNTTTSYSVVVAADGTWQIDNIDVQRLGRRHTHLHRHDERSGRQRGPKQHHRRKECRDRGQPGGIRLCRRQRQQRVRPRRGRSGGCDTHADGRRRPR